MMRALGLSTAAAGALSSAAAQPLPTAFVEKCPDPRASIQKWCAPKAIEQGWTLKYEDKSPTNLMDAFWQIELWVRDRDAVLCEFKGGRGGIRENGCRPMREVDR